MSLDLINRNPGAAINYANIAYQAGRVVGKVYRAYKAYRRRNPQSAMSGRKRKSENISKEVKQDLAAEKMDNSWSYNRKKSEDGITTNKLVINSAKSKVKKITFDEFYRNLWPLVKQRIRSYGGWTQCSKTANFSATNSPGFALTNYNALPPNITYNTTDFAPISASTDVSARQRNLGWTLGHQEMFQFLHLPCQPCISLGQTSMHNYQSMQTAAQYYPGLPSGGRGVLGFAAGGLSTTVQLSTYQLYAINGSAGSDPGTFDMMNTSLICHGGYCLHDFYNPGNNEVIMYVQEFTPRRYLHNDTPIDNIYRDKVKKLNTNNYEVQGATTIQQPECCSPKYIGFEWKRDDEMCNFNFRAGKRKKYVVNPGDHVEVKVEYPKFSHTGAPWAKSLINSFSNSNLVNQCPQFTKWLVVTCHGSIAHADQSGYLQAVYSATPNEGKGVNYARGQLVHTQTEQYYFQGAPQSQPTIEIALNGLIDTNFIEYVVNEENDEQKQLKY